MTEDTKVIYSFDLPLYEVPQQQFREAMNLFSRSQPLLSAIVSYYKGELTFTFITTNGEKHSSSVIPVPTNFPRNRIPKVSGQISAFSSKLNSSMSLANRDKGFSAIVDVVEPTSQDKTSYGKAVRAVIKVTITVTSFPVVEAMESFFSVIDSSPLTVGKK